MKLRRGCSNPICDPSYKKEKVKRKLLFEVLRILKKKMVLFWEKASLNSQRRLRNKAKDFPECAAVRYPNRYWVTSCFCGKGSLGATEIRGLVILSLSRRKMIPAICQSQKSAWTNKCIRFEGRHTSFRRAWRRRRMRVLKFGTH